MTEYIHYGCAEFNHNKFQTIKNRKLSTKPTGGLWASKVNAKNSWYKWCLSNEYNLSSLNKSFRFTIKEGSNILVVNSISDVERLPHINTDDVLIPWHCLDFEKLSINGVDAIEISIEGDGIYFGLYGWDCDSILIMNKDIIENISSKKYNIIMDDYQ